MASPLSYRGLLAALALCAGLAVASEKKDEAGDAASPTAAEPPVAQRSPSNPESVEAADPAALREDLNLLGQAATDSGESRRNENVQFNAIDNNSVKELNLRLGVTATIVEEFEPERGYFGAEFGASSDGSVHVASRPSSALHGSAYFRHNNSILSARSFFQVGAVQPARENEYGADFLLPVWQGGLLSISASAQDIRGNVNGNVLVPQADERTPLATDPQSRTIVDRFLAAYGSELPNRTDINPRALNTNSPQAIDTNLAAGRLHQDLGERDRLIGDYRVTLQEVDAFQLIAGQNPDTTIRNHHAALTWSRTWSANTTTDLTAAFDRIGSLLRPEENAVGPSASIGGVLEPLGPSSRLPIDRAENRFRYGGRVRLVRGNHNWSAGFELLRRQLNGSQVSSHRGVLQFRSDFGRDAITNLRMGTPSRFSTGIGDPHRGFRSWDSLLYFGDSWRATPALTLNYGLRYEAHGSPHEVNKLTEIPYSGDNNNLGGHLGFAVRLPGRWGIVRASGGLHYAALMPATYQQARFNPPKIFKLVVVEPSLIDPLEGITEDDLNPDSRATRILLSPELVSPYAGQYNFSWEPTIVGEWKLQLGYVGSRSVKLIQKIYNNRARNIEGIPATTSTINDRRPDQNTFDRRDIVNSSRGYYDAARVTLLIPRFQGFTIDASYWFSKAIDLGAGYVDTGSGSGVIELRNQHEGDVHGDLKGLSSFDQPHAFLLRATYESPRLVGGPRWVRGLFSEWAISAVTLLKNGTPFTVIAGSDSPGFGNVDGSSGDRPHIIDPSILGRTIGHPDSAAQLLPQSAFAFVQPGERAGSLGRNTFRKGSIANVNAALFRSWALSSDARLTFRIESVNFFNTPQFADPGKTLSAPDFGQITNTLNEGRTFRTGLSVHF